MNRTQLKKELKIIEKTAIEEFNKRGGWDVTLYIMGDIEKNGKNVKGVTSFPIPSFLMGARDKVVFNLGKSINDGNFQRITGINVKKVNAVAMASEAWMSKVSKEEGEKIEKGEKSYLPPSQDPKRKEILVFSIMNESKEVVTSAYEIKRKGLKATLKKSNFENKVDEAKSPLLDNFWNGLLQLVQPMQFWQ